MGWAEGFLTRARGEDVADRVPFEKMTRSHPRLFFNRKMFRNIQIMALGPQKDHFARVRRWVTAAGKKRKEGSADFGEQAASAAFLFLCEGKPEDLALAKALLETSVKFFEECVEKKKSVNWYSTSRIHAISAYDWLFDHLSKEERRRIGQALLDHVEAVQPGPGKPKVHRRNLSDHKTGFYGTPSLLWYAGVATLGSGIDEKRSKAYVERGYTMYNKLLRHRRDAAGDDGGSASPTLAYAMGAYPWAEFGFLHTMRSAFGRDIAPEWPYVAYFTGYVMWNWLPGNREFGCGDAYHLTNELPEWQTYSHLAQIRHFYGKSEPHCAALAAWMQGRCKQQKHSLSWPIIPFLLTKLPASPAPKPPSSVLPPARHFERMGQVFMRSGSGEGDTYAVFIGGGILKQHKHYDENSFLIYKKGFLALDTGSRPEPGSHLFQYYCRSVAHNCILIRQEGEVLPRYWGSRAPGEPDLPIPNDGGMMHQIGSVIRAFHTTPDYTYVASDATACYSPEKCALALRQFLFLPPDHFVIFDRVTAKRPVDKKTWILHTAREPRMQENGFSAVHEEGVLFCKTLLPKEAVLTKIGGPGKQFWNDGRNWPIPKNWSRVKPSVEDHELLGQWRVEVSPKKPRRDDCFLHLIEVGDRKKKTRMVEAEFTKRGRDVEITFQSKGRKWKIRFAAVGPPAGSVEITGSAKPIKAKLNNTVKKQKGLTGE
jgi:heparin/heparan-sulfate lyase